MVLSICSQDLKEWKISAGMLPKIESSNWEVVASTPRLSLQSKMAASGVKSHSSCNTFILLYLLYFILPFLTKFVALNQPYTQ